jgi:hypothetical protein
MNPSSIVLVFVVLASVPRVPACALGSEDPFEIRTLSAGYRPGTEPANLVRSTPDGAWTLAAFCEPGEDRWCWIASFPRSGGSPIELTGAIWVGANESAEFHLSPDGHRVIFLRRTNAAAARELWSRPVDGSTAAVRLRATGVDDVVYRIGFTPDSQSVHFVHRRPGESEELWIVPAAGGAGRRLDSGDFDGRGLAFDPSLTHAVYWNEIGDEPELRAVALAGGDAWTLGGIVLPPFAVEEEPIVTADGLRVVFVAGYDDPDAVEVWSVPLAAAGASVRISGEHPVGSDVDDFAITPGGRVVYRWRTGSAAPYRLSSAPADGSAPATFVDGGLVAGGEVQSMRIASEHVVFVADAAVDQKWELWSAPVDGSGIRTRRSAALAADRDVSSFKVAPDGLRVVYRADATVDSRSDLYSTTVLGFAAILRLSNLELFGADYDVMSYVVAGDSRTAVYETAVAGQYDGRLIVQDLREPTPFPASFETAPESVSFASADNGAVVIFAAQRNGDWRKELHLADRCFFADGFESGDTTGWSSTVP